MDAQPAVRPDSGPKRSRRDPQQSRSKKTLERILAVAEGLLDGRDFENLSIQEICAAADVTRSSFYARFETKEALLFKLHERHRKTRFEKVQMHAAEVDWGALSLVDVVRNCIALYVEDREAHDPFIRSLTQAEIRHPFISEERERIDNFGMMAIRDHMLARVGAADPALSRRIEFAIRAICAAAQEAIRPPHRFASQMNLSDSELIDELTHLFCDYVRFPVSAADTEKEPT